MNDARVEQSGPLISVVVAVFQGADTLQDRKSVV